MQFLKPKGFTRWASKEGISDATLRLAALEIVAGQVEASLGGFLFKKRIAKDGGGKNGGYRIIVCFKRHDDSNVFFMHGFDKGDIGNITPKQEKALRQIAKHYVGLSREQVSALISNGLLFEIKEDHDGHA